tara:strand:- start:7283 stop:7981 length:699 start_codon:yes stop_codon:yes gene_type:complete
MTQKILTDQNLITIIRILKENKIKYWIGQGTLLGIIREGKLIDWDHDIDICLWPEEIEKIKIVNILKKNNFIFRDDLTFGEKFDQLSFDKPGGRRVDINYYQKKKLKDNTIVACVKYGFPRNKLMNLIDAITLSNVYEGKYKNVIKKLKFLSPVTKHLKNFLVKIGIFYKSAGYMQPMDLLEKFKEINFHGLNLTIPVDAEKYLEHVYGKNWRQPVKNFTWWKMKNINTDYE